MKVQKLMQKQLTLIFALGGDDPERTRVGAGFADEQVEAGRRRLDRRRRRTGRPAGVWRTAGAAVALINVRVVQVVVVDGRLEGEVDGVRRRNRLHFRRRMRFGPAKDENRSAALLALAHCRGFNLGAAAHTHCGPHHRYQFPAISPRAHPRKWQPTPRAAPNGPATHSRLPPELNFCSNFVNWQVIFNSKVAHDCISDLRKKVKNVFFRDWGWELGGIASLGCIVICMRVQNFDLGAAWFAAEAH